MSRNDCVSNRNIKVIAAYVQSKLGHHDLLFENLPYPTDRYSCPEDFFLNEDEWTTFANFQTVFRKAEKMVGEPHFYFKCGASSAALRSWGRFDYFVRVFRSPSDGYRRIPFFNENINDTKDIEIIFPPHRDRLSGKTRTLMKVAYHPDIDVQKDYISDPYRRGIISSIPTIWGLEPARIRQPLSPFDPEILFNHEAEFMPFGLDAEMEQDLLTITHPLDSRRRVIGKKIYLEPEAVNGQEVFLGRYSEDPTTHDKGHSAPEAVVITETVEVGGRILCRANEIFKAPYFILDVTYDDLSFLERIALVFKTRQKFLEPGKGLIETINSLRETIEARNRAYRELEMTNAMLISAKKEVEDYATNLKHMVADRTRELRMAKDELVQFNRDLEDRVNAQVQELKRYDELRRYFSPKLTEKILTGGDTLGADPQRKMMTVVFSDIRNFSAFTDSLEPEELFHLMDRYLSEMTQIIHRYEGTLNKIIGDGLLIFFGDPIPFEDHALRAVHMAVDMQRRVSELRKEWFHYGHEFGIGIGINTGFMTVGNIGSDMHRDYTVIGNQVNVAARLEAAAGAGQILISHRTYSRVKDIFPAEKLGEIQVKGIHQPVVTYNVKALPI
ncbi:MAG: adenylate/guanylate cyclase domain-containing protein [Desulfatiglandales bacterium]